MAVNKTLTNLVDIALKKKKLEQLKKIKIEKQAERAASKAGSETPSVIQEAVSEVSPSAKAAATGNNEVLDATLPSQAAEIPSGQQTRQVKGLTGGTLKGDGVKNFKPKEVSDVIPTPKEDSSIPNFELVDNSGINFELVGNDAALAKATAETRVLQHSGIAGKIEAHPFISAGVAAGVGFAGTSLYNR